MAPRLPQLGPRMRAVVKYFGLTVFAVVVFVFALQLTFPYDRVKDKLVESLSDKYEVTVMEVKRGILPGRVSFKAVSLSSRPTKPEETITKFFIKQLDIKPSLLSLIGGTISVDFDAQIGAGMLSGHVAIGKFGRGDIAAEITGSALPGDALPMRSALGLPMTGKIEFSVSIKLPMEKSKTGKTAISWQKAKGTFVLACPSGCTIGDGVTKLKPLLKNTRNQVMVGEGIDFGKVHMDSLSAKATIKGGKLTLEKFDAKSKDGELKVDYMMTLEKDFSESMVAGCLRFKGSDDLLKREPKTYAAIQTTGAELRGDGLFHIRLTDRFKDMKRLNQECGPGTNTNGNGENFKDGKSERPNLTVQPDEKPTAIAAPPPPTPTPAETPPAADAAVGSASPTGGPAAGPLPDGPAATPVISNDPPRERAGQQNRMEPPQPPLPDGSAGSGSGAANATPPPE
jgi:type II secretion system protein N